MNIEDYIKNVPKVQKEQLRILEEFDNFCAENQLRYSLHWGTLLGAIRHKGFIPWDDDIDVGMPRDDFDKLLELKANFNSQYFIQHYSTDESFFPFIKIRKNGTKMVMNSSKEGAFHQGIWIDVFPLDRVPKDKIARKIYSARVWILQQIVITQLYSKVKSTTNFFNRQVRRFFYILNRLFPKNFFNIKLDKLLRKYRDTNNFYGDLISGSTYKATLNLSIDPKDIYSPQVKTFENKSFLVFNNYDKYLKQMFGNYKKLPPVEDRQPHHGVVELKFEE